MHPFEVMSEPIRRRIVDILASGEHTAGMLEEIIVAEFGVGRSAVQHHLRLFLRCGWTRVREEWPNRWHRLAPQTIPRLEREVRRLRLRWDRRIGWDTGTDPLPSRISAAGRAGAVGAPIRTIRGGTDDRSDAPPAPARLEA